MESHNSHKEIVDGLKSRCGEKIQAISSAYSQFASDSSTPQEFFTSETFGSALHRKNSEKPNMSQISADLKPFPFMTLPFDIRRLIYEELYPTKQTIQFSQMDRKAPSFPTTGVYKLPKASTAFLRTCRLVNDEAYDVLYGMNKIVFWPKLENLIWSAANDRVSINSLPPSICQKISEFHINLDGKIHVLEKLSLLKALPYFPKVLITVMIHLREDLRRHNPQGHPRYWLLRRLQTDCKEIGRARAKSGLTLWDDLEEPDAKRMLERALPEGYQKGVCLDMRDWWKESDGWRKRLWFDYGL